MTHAWFETVEGEGLSEAALHAVVRERMGPLCVLHLRGVRPAGPALAFWRRAGEVLGRNADVLESSDGLPIPSNGGWMDVRFEPDRLDTYRHANVGQPLHADRAYSGEPQDIGLFYLAKQAQSGGHSLFIDATTVAREAARDGDLLHRLTTIPVGHGKGAMGRCLPILSEHAGRMKINWNWFRVLPGQGEAVDALREDFRLFLERMVETGVAKRIRLETGDAVFFRDDEVLHGRAAFAAQASGDRLLWKTYFVTPEAEALARAA